MVRQQACGFAGDRNAWGREPVSASISKVIRREVMSKINDPNDSENQREGGAWGRPGGSRRRVALCSIAVAGGLLFIAQALQSPEAHAFTHAASSGGASAAAPAPGTTWVEGVITDSCGQGQDDVNVEAWSDGGAPTASALTYGGPAASALTYGGPRFDAQQGHGFFRLEVPSNQPYRIAFSAVGGQEDGDPFLMAWYGMNRPIMVRQAAKGAAALPPGRMRDLGTIQLARQAQGPATSTTTAKARGKLHAGNRGKLKVTVAGSGCAAVTGKLVVKVAGHSVSRQLRPGDRGSRTIRLPKLRRPGKYSVRVSFSGSSAVQGSRAKAKVKVMGKGKGKGAK
jgi:hypothetical protein